MTTDPQHAPVRDLLGAYLLDAVDEEERRLVDEHLLTCAECARELEELTPTVEALGGAAHPVPPPDRIRAALVAAASTGPGSTTPDGTTPDGTTPDGTTPENTAPMGPAPATDARAGLRLGLLAAAAAAVALVMFLAFGPLRDSPEVTTETVATAADAQRFEARLGPATATVIISRALDRAALETREMAPAPTGLDYQLWLTHADGTMTDAGLMPREEDAAMVLGDGIGDAVGLAVTLEPEGGSPQPTGEPVLVIPFEA